MFHEIHETAQCHSHHLWQNAVLFEYFCHFHNFLLHPNSVVIKHQDLINIFLIYVFLPLLYHQFNGNSWKAWNQTKETIFDIMFCSIMQYRFWNKGPFRAIFRNGFQYFEIFFQFPIPSFLIYYYYREKE